MATLIKAPKDFLEIKNIVGSLFLAGSISMGKAENWQDKVYQELKNIPGLGILNPRRDNWNSSWKQEITNNKFKEQVEWELSAIESVDVVAMYFDPSTKSPISLLELGLISHRFTQFTPELIVFCPEKFWKKGNVDIVCKRYGHEIANDWEDFINKLKSKFDYLNNLGNDFDIKDCKINWSTNTKKNN